MKKYIQKPGVRRWHGDELVGLQTETLNFLFDFFKYYSGSQPIIISGIDVSVGSTSALMNISPGYIGFPVGSGFVIASYAGASNVGKPFHLKLSTTVSQKLYNDGVNRDASESYTAVSSTTSGNGILTIDSVDSILLRLPAALVSKSTVTGNIAIDNSNSNQSQPYQLTGALNYKIDRASKLCHIYGNITLSQINGSFLSGVSHVQDLPDAIIPIGFVPVNCQITNQVASSGRVIYATPGHSGSYAVMDEVYMNIQVSAAGVAALYAKIIPPDNYTSIQASFNTSYILA